MDSMNLDGVKPPKIDSMHNSSEEEHLVTEDFHHTDVPRSSLVELILPFAEESKSMENDNGLTPW